MASVFKVWITRRDESGRKIKRRSKKYYGQYKNHDDKTVRVPLCEDRQASQGMLTELIRKANRIRSGEVDRYDDHRKRPLADHVTDFKDALTHKGITPDHVALTISRVRRIVAECSFNRISEIDGEEVRRILAKWKTSEGMGATTRNHYLGAMKHFTRWLMRSRRAPDDCLVHLVMENARSDIRVKRRELADAEIAWLLKTTLTLQPRCCLTGEQRVMLYCTAMGTGLRASELASLTPRSFDFSADPCTVTIEAAKEKARRGATLPMPDGLVKVLKPYVSRFDRDAQLWPGVWAAQKRAGVMLHLDMEAAKDAWVDEVKGNDQAREERERSDFLECLNSDGESIDFHALRHTYLSRLARSGANLKAIQTLARHSTITLTMDRYAHASLLDLSSAVRRLPALPTGIPQEQGLRLTGS